MTDAPSLPWFLLSPSFCFHTLRELQQRVVVVQQRQQQQQQQKLRIMNVCSQQREAERGGKITHSLFTHRRLNRNMEVYTRMMSDPSQPACLFSPLPVGVSPFSREILGFPASRCRSLKLTLVPQKADSRNGHSHREVAVASRSSSSSPV